MTDSAHASDRDAESTALVVVPTFNERQNLGSIVRRLRTAVPAADILVVDDNSPDGTGQLAREIASDDRAVHVLHRTEKAGLGAAYVAGFDWAVENRYDPVVEMDADGSHAPEELPVMLEHIRRGADVVLGSRYVPGGKVLNWPWYRSLLSRGGNLYSKWALGVDLEDMTGGFRVYRARVLGKVKLHTVASQGYCFQVDLALRAFEAGFVVTEVPITFTERTNGQSKMSRSIVREALVRVTKWGLRRRAEKVRHVLPARGRAR